MHPIQSHILKQLTYSKTARYADLKPDGVESNRFVYHLKKLIDDGSVSKIKEGYALTPRGERYVDRLTLKTFQPRFQPKIVTLLICKNQKGEFLLYFRKHQPFLGLFNFPYGKIHFGENIVEAAHRELKEKANLTAKLEHRGDAYITIREKGEIVTHMLCHVFVGSQISGDLKEETSTGYCKWQKLNEIETKKFVPGFLSIYKLAQTKKHFFKEILI